MTLSYPGRPHERRHGPARYTNFVSFKPWLRDEFAFRCVYCLGRERWNPSGHAAFGIDHVAPQSARPDLICVYINLVYACLECNSSKRDLVLPDPCAVSLGLWLSIAINGRVIPAPGADMTTFALLVETLALNAPHRVEFRRRMVRLAQTVALRPNDPAIREQYSAFFGYPADLPNLAVLRPPGGNSHPDGVRDSYYRKRAEDRLAEPY